jgi:hypothetical protein
MNEGLQAKAIKNYSLMRWIIICGALLLIVLLFGSVPLFISYRNTMDR